MYTIVWFFYSVFALFCLFAVSMVASLDGLALLVYLPFGKINIVVVCDIHRGINAYT